MEKQGIKKTSSVVTKVISLIALVATIASIYYVATRSGGDTSPTMKAEFNLSSQS